MKRIQKFGAATFLAALVVCLLDQDIEALTVKSENELSLSGGWRQDHLRSFATTNVDSSTDLVRGSHLNIWQVGVQGWMSPSFCTSTSWLDNFFVRGSAYWGWVNDGVYLHRTTPAPDTTVTYNRGDVSHGHTWDYNVGGGYLFDCGCVKFGPAGGYSYNKLTFKGENVIGVTDTLNTSQAIDPNAYFDEGVLVSSRWQGPWAGADAFWECNNWNVYASYEYHWAQWKGAYHSPSTDLTDGSHYSDRRTGSKGWGHTGYLGAHYTFCDCWLAGVGVKYQYYHVKGRLRPTASGGFPSVGGTADETDHVKTVWNSVSLFLDLGCIF